MKAKLTAHVCYIAGLYSKGPKREKNFVSVNTGVEELKQLFIEIAVKELGVLPSKVLFGHESDKSVGFYHSRIAKQLLDIANRENYIFKITNELSSSYVAGMFDASGHFSAGGLEIRHVTPKDAMMLENLGIHTKGDKILNIGRFMELIKGRSIILGQIKLRDD